MNEEPPHKTTQGWVLALILVLLYALIFWPKPGQAADTMVGGAGARLSFIDSGERVDYLQREGSIPSPTTNKWWLVIPATSWHEVPKPYNEDNWGIGLEYKFNLQWAAIGGAYENSLSETSVYIGGIHTPAFLQFQLKQLTIKPGTMLSVVSGYSDKLALIIAPTLQMEIEDKVGIDLLVGCKNLRCKKGVIGLSFKFTKGVLE